MIPNVNNALCGRWSHHDDFDQSPAHDDISEPIYGLCVNVTRQKLRRRSIKTLALNMHRMRA